MTDICAECYEATKDVIRATPTLLSNEIKQWILCGLFDDAVDERCRQLRIPPDRP